MGRDYCGLDFGTSNSTVGTICGNAPTLLPLEDGRPTLPSALFFNFEENTTCFGRRAIREYVEGTQGRLMRALKSVLGSSLIHDATQIKNRRIAFPDILGMFIAHLKAQAEQETGTSLTSVVMGRPVQFVDDNPDADAQALHQLEKATRAQGFRHISFQFEPIAAALDYEQRVTREQLAFIVDIGGGTSDFSIVRVSPQRARAAERKDDILANTGIHIGGTDFDRIFSMERVMPEFGYRTPNRNGKQDLPSSYYFDLATWQRINRLYGNQVMHGLRQLRYEAEYPERVDRLITLLENRQGHHLAGKVEAAKIRLTDHPDATIGLNLPDGALSLSTSREEFNITIESAVAQITATVRNTLTQAGVGAEQVDALFLTGGSTQIPLLKAAILSLFPGASVVEGDTFGSVGLGLALDAHRKFN